MERALYQISIIITIIIIINNNNNNIIIIIIIIIAKLSVSICKQMILCRGNNSEIQKVSYKINFMPISSIGTTDPKWYNTCIFLNTHLSMRYLSSILNTPMTCSQGRTDVPIQVLYNIRTMPVWPFSSHTNDAELSLSWHPFKPIPTKVQYRHIYAMPVQAFSTSL